MWYRIFSSESTMPTPEELRAFLAAGHGEFAADDGGWYRGDLKVDSISFEIERYVADEPGIRAELNGWAAWLETREGEPEHTRLMERVIQTRQLFTLRADEDSSRAAEKCLALCRFIAEKTSGIYQIDGEGFYSVEGRSLVSEPEA